MLSGSRYVYWFWHELSRRQFKAMTGASQWPIIRCVSRYAISFLSGFAFRGLVESVANPGRQFQSCAVCRFLPCKFIGSDEPQLKPLVCSFLVRLWWSTAFRFHAEIVRTENLSSTTKYQLTIYLMSVQ